MTARRAVVMAAYWTAVTLTAAIAATAAAIPFTGLTSGIASTLATAAICGTGIALAPQGRP